MQKNNTLFSVRSGIALLLVFILLFLVGSCKKDDLLTDGSVQLNLGTDTLTFDTVFVSLGSTTQFFTIRNTNNRPIKISNIVLGGGASSQFRFNVDGDPVPSGSIADIEIPAEDSIYVFVEVTVDPNEDGLPFLLLDSLQFETNGNLQKVILQAYGQNAHFYNGEELDVNTLWEDDLPYVILNSLLVKTGVTLTINEGCDIYMGSNSGIFVEGTMQVLGQQDSLKKVTFRGVRLDKITSGTYYDELPGQWLGLFFLRNSTGNLIEHARIRNSLYGINAGNFREGETPTAANAPELVIKNSEIYNHAYYGIFALLADIRGENLLVHSCGRNALSVLMGGKYNFEHCTFYSRSTAFQDHRDPVMVVTNYLPISATENLMADLEEATFKNCIVYGTEKEEVLVDSIQPTIGDPYFYLIRTSFDHCLLKTTEVAGNPPYISCIYNQDPDFEDVSVWDYHLTVDSPARMAGASTLVGNDLDGVPRADPPDIGVYQFP